MKQLLKKILNSLLTKFGYEVRRKGIIRTTMREFIEYISIFGYNPKTVIDVGVAQGTFELYEGFPNATHVLIEPVREFKEALEEMSRQFKTKIVLAAANDSPGTVIINVHPVLTGSSLLKEAEGNHVDGFQREVEAVTIDNLIRDNNLEGPYLIKVDVQGGEIQVLNGANAIMKHTEVIILEVNMFQFFIDGPQFFDIVSYMKRYGYCVYDVFGQHYRPLDGALASLDIAFVKENGQFRKSHHWASMPQREIITKSLLHQSKA